MNDHTPLSNAAPAAADRAMDPACRLALAASFGSVEGWRDAFVAHALAGPRRWLLLHYDAVAGALRHLGVDDPAQLPDGNPILALDRGTLVAGPGAGPDRAGVEAFVAGVDWPAAYDRYRHVVTAASDLYGASADDGADALWLDVRRDAVFRQSESMIAGAQWRDPVAVASWVAALPAGRALVVYCVHGHEVSRATALRLRAAGATARFLRGGLEAWRAAGRALAAGPAAPGG